MRIDEKYFKVTDGTAVTAIDDQLLDGESVLWRAKPNRRAYILAAVVKMMPIALLWLAFDTAFIVMLSIGMSGGNFPKWILAFLIPFFLFHLMPVWMWIGNVVKAVTELKNVEYAFTDRRIVARSGVIGVDFKYIAYEEVDSVNAKVGVIDKLCRVGDLYISAKGQSVVLYDIENPYLIAAKLQKIVADIKSDMQFPNAYRPSENKGYDSAYTGSPFDGDES